MLKKLLLFSFSLLSPLLLCGQVSCVPRLNAPYSYCDAVNALVTDNVIGVDYSNNFFLPEIGRSTLGMVYPAKAVNTAAGFSFYGFSEYWNINLSLGFSRWFKPYVAFGVRAFFYGCHFTSHDASFLASGGADVSLLVFPTKSLSIGFYARNITFSSIKSLEERYRLPVDFSLGFSYNFSGKVILALEGGIELKQPFRISMCVDYAPVRQFVMRFVVSYQTSAAASLGFGLRFGGFFLDFDAEYKLISGMCCKAGIGVTFKKRKK